MTPTTLETVTEDAKACGREQAAEVVRQASHLAHEARRLKTLATDAVEDGLHAAKRTMTRSFRSAEDLRDKTAYRIKQAPFATVALALAAGVFLGMAAFWGLKNRRE